MASEARPDTPTGFDAVADRLYALHPDAFAAARDEAVKQARTANDAPLARELAKLRRPTQSAWIVNLLWRDQAPVLEQLFQIADGLALAQAQSAGAEFRELLGLRRQLESALLRQAEALAAANGTRPTAATMREVQETLASALTSREVADEVRSGRLVKPPGPVVGFGEPGSAPVAAPTASRPVQKVVALDERRLAAERERQERARAEAQRTAAAAEAREQARAEEEARRAEEERQRQEEEARRQAEEQRRREEAERRRREAREAVAAADALLAEESAAHEAAASQSAELRGRVEALRVQLQAAEADARAAEDALAAAARRREHAAKAYEAAVRALASLD